MSRRSPICLVVAYWSSSRLQPSAATFWLEAGLPAPIASAGCGLRHGHGEAGELVVAVALADPEVEAAAREQVERRGLLGQQHGVVPGQHDDRGAEPQRRGARADPGQ